MKNLIKYSFLLCTCLFLMFSGCKKDEIATCSDGIRNGNETGIDCGGNCAACDPGESTIRGKVQKGPFLNGSSVQLNELDSNYVQTGISFTTQILDNTGQFAFNTIPLASPYVTVRADGFYFNEVCGGNSATQITLNAISDIPTDGQVNVNVLTHLEKARVEYLLENTTLSFLQAKEQALGEVLAIFNINPNSLLDRAETLDLSQSSEGDAILIAVSSILQGYRTEVEFSDLMAAIIADIRTDGVLNNQDLGADLVLQAKALDTLAIRQNIVDRYTELGLPVSVPGFGQYVETFLDSTAFPSTTPAFDYPLTGPFFYLDNILHPGFYNPNNQSIVIDPDSAQFGMVANILPGCVDFKIVVTRVDTGSCPFTNYCFGMGSSGTTKNVIIEPLDTLTRSQTLRPSGEGTELTTGLGLGGGGTFRIDTYEKPAEPIPTRSVTIVVQ